MPYLQGLCDPRIAASSIVCVLRMLSTMQEIANGRLAMLSCVAYAAQYYATDKGPWQNLTDHVASPWTVNFATNGVSIPTGNL